MKKLTPLFLILAMCSLLTACGGGAESTGNDGRDTSSSASAPVLSWIAPTTRSDSSYLPANELMGYRIYYGTSSSNLSVLVDLNDESITEYTVDTLPSGNYYFAVTAYDMDGNESGLSNLINKDV